MLHLNEVDFRANRLGDDGLVALAVASARGHLPQLRVLGVCHNGVTDNGAAALASAVAGCGMPPAFAKLETLTMTYNTIGAEGMEWLAIAIGDGALPRLLSLSLGGNKSPDAVVQQALHVPSDVRMEAAKQAGGNGFQYVGGECASTVGRSAGGCGGGAGNALGRAWLRQAVRAGERSFW